MSRHPFEHAAEELLLKLKAIDRQPKRKGRKEASDARRQIAADALGLLMHCGGPPSLVSLFEQLIASGKSVFSWVAEKDRKQAARTIAILFEAENPNARERAVARMLAKELGGDVEKYRDQVEGFRADEKYQSDVQYFRRLSTQPGYPKMIEAGRPFGGEYG